MGIFTEDSNAFAPLAMLKSLGDIPLNSQAQTPVSPNDMLREAMNLPPLNMLKAVGDIPFDRQSQAPVSPNDMLQALSQLMELKPTEFHPSSGVSLQDMLQGVGNYAGDVKDFYGNLMQKGASAIFPKLANRPSSMTSNTGGDIAYNPKAAKEPMPLSDEELAAQKAKSEKDALQKSYDQITKYESVIGEMPPKLQAMARPMIAQWLREDGAPSDLVSIYSQHGGAAPAVHQEFQARMAKPEATQAQQDAKFMHEQIMKSFDAERMATMQERTAHYKMKGEDLYNEDPTLATPHGMPGFRTFTPNKDAIDAKYKLPNIQDMVKMFAGDNLKPEERTALQQAAPNRKAQVIQQTALGMPGKGTK